MSTTKIFGISSGLLGSMLVVGLWACSNKEPNAAAKPSPEPPAEPAGSMTSPSPEGGKYEAVEVKDGGTISGTVTWDGPPVEPKMVDITKDEATCGKHGKQRPSEEIIVKDKKLKNVLVTIDIKKGEAFKADQPVVFDQKECLFLKHVSVVPVGSTIKVTNSDDILHNTHFNAQKNKGENMAIPAGKSQEYKVASTENIKVTCDIHPWMNAYLVVRDNPYYAVTDENGSYSIKNVPPGKYKVSFWQESVGKQGGQEIEVKTGADTKADFGVKPK